MSSLRSSISSRIGSTPKTYESDKGRPPSPAGSSIKTNRSEKKIKISWFKKRAVQKSMESSVRSEESIAIVQPAAAQGATVILAHEPEPARDVIPLLQITPASPAVGDADLNIVFDAAERPPEVFQPVAVQLEDHHGDALRRMDQGDHHDANDETVHSSSLDQSAILSGLDSITYAGGARRLSLDTSPPIKAEGEVLGVEIETPRSPMGYYRTVSLLVCLVAVTGWSIFCFFLGSYFGGFAPATAGDSNTTVLDLPSPNCPLPSPTAPLSTSVTPVQSMSRWIFPP